MKIKILQIIFLVIIPVLVWWPVFNTSFFMEDFYFLYLTNVGSFRDFLAILMPVHDVIYRPVSQQVLLHLLQKVFGLVPYYYANFFFGIHLINGILVLRLLEALLKDKWKSVLLAGVFVNSAIFFTGLYSLVTSHFLVGLMFGLLGLLVWLRTDIGARLRTWSSWGWMTLALFSSEYTLVFIPIMFLLRADKKDLIRLIPHSVTAAIVVLINLMWAGERNSDFMTQMSAIPSLVQWYLLRGLGLPEGVRNGDEFYVMALYGLLAVVLGVLAISLFRSWKKMLAAKYELVIYGSWVFGGCLPFLLLPNHLNAVYFGISLIGMLVILGMVITDPKLLIGFSLASVLMGFLGVRLLMDTHWMVRRATLVRTAFQTAEIRPKKAVFRADNQSDLDELQLSLYGDLGPKVMMRNRELEVNYLITGK